MLEKSGLVQHFIRNSFTTFESLLEMSRVRRIGALVRLRFVDERQMNLGGTT